MNEPIDKSWHGPAIAACLNIVGMGMSVVIGRAVAHPPWWPNAVTAGLSALFLGLMLAGFRGPRFLAVGFVLFNLAVACTLWITDDYFAASWRAWVPFRPHQLGILAIALLAPPALWSGLASIALFVGTAVLHYFLFDPAIRARLPGGEVSVMLIYGMFGVALLIYRSKRLDAERARVQAQTEAAALQRLARSFLALRDLANTPLQTIDATVLLLRERHPELRAETDRILRALTRLREGHRLLAGYDAYLPWDPSDESFDAVEVLKKLTPPRQP